MKKGRKKGRKRKEGRKEERNVGKKKELMRVVRERQLRFFGHVIRREGMENLIIKNKGQGAPVVPGS